MKRRLPITIHGEFVLAATKAPPHTADTNRHRPTSNHPGNPQARSHAAAMAVTAARRSPATAASGSPPSSTTSPAKPAAHRPA